MLPCPRASGAFTVARDRYRIFTGELLQTITSRSP
jgi:hypothetical protein